MLPLQMLKYSCLRSLIQESTDIIEKAKGQQKAGQTKSRKALSELLKGFAAELAAVRVLDPACGSGNFLYVALKRLLDLEKEVSVFAASNGLSGLLPLTNPAQLYGIETNVYAHELASVVVWIGYIQWQHDNGFIIGSHPVLRPLQNIKLMDSVLACTEMGLPVEAEWPDADVIIGNPPFLGGKKLRTELGDKYVNDLFKVYDQRVPREADFVCYWFEKARQQIEKHKANRVGLLATQGIRGGANRTVLGRIKESGDIFWAQSDRDWVLDGATVHVSMVGFDDGTEKSKVLNSVAVGNINADLTSGLDLTQAAVLRENVGLAFMGDTKVGPFELSAEQAGPMIAAVGNPNGRPNSDVVRPWANGMDVTRRSRNMWIVDFGTDMTEAAAAQYEMPFEYIHKHVKPFRVTAKSGDCTGVPWWLHQRPRPDMRTGIARVTRFVATPTVAKHRLFVWLTGETLPDHQLIVITRDDDYFFGVLHSTPHELWARRKGTQLREAESGSRYTPTSTFETFPFPWAPGEEPTGNARVEAIANASRDLVKKRDLWLNPSGASPSELKKRTLTNLYNENPTWLQDAHRALDKTVLSAYGWPKDLTDQGILARLLQLNAERFAQHPSGIM